jgi:serine/threonine protein kinase
VLRDQGGSGQAKIRFLQEARAASAWNHPNIVQIYELASQDGDDFIVMEFVPGRTLAQLLREKRLTIEEALHYSTQIASALAAAHAAASNSNSRTLPVIIRGSPGPPRYRPAEARDSHLFRRANSPGLSNKSIATRPKMSQGEPERGNAASAVGLPGG